MDGVVPNDGVVVLAATNRLSVLDPALVRPGRFDRIVKVPPPDLLGREQILRVHANRVAMAPDVDLGDTARETKGLVGAELAAIVNEAAVRAVRAGRNEVTNRAAQGCEHPNFKGSYLGRFPLVLADFWTSDHLSERSRSMTVVSRTRARGTAKMKRR